MLPSLARPALAALAPLAILAALAPFIHLGLVVGAVLSYATAAAAIVLSSALAPTALLATRTGAVRTISVGVVLSATAVALPPVASGIVGSLGVIACATALGSVVGTRVQAAGHLLAVALVSAGVDILSVGAPEGVTHEIVQHPALLQLLMVRAAVPPDRAPASAIGFGDVVFAALYLSACGRFGLARWRSVLALSVGLLGAWGVAVLAGLTAGIPALPFMGGAMVALHPEVRQVAPRDRTATWVAGAFMLGAILRVALR